MNEKIALAYKKFSCHLNLQRARVACLLGSFLLVASSVLDAFMEPEYFKPFLLIRIIGAICVLIVYSITFTPWGKDNGLFLGMMVVFFTSLTLSILIHRLGYESPYYAGLNLIILAIGVLFTWEFYQALLSSIGVYLMYLVPILILNEIGNYKIFVNNNLFIIETVIIAVAASYFTSKLRRRDFESRYRLGDSVKELKEAYEDLKSTQAQLLHSAKLASVGQLAAGVAHELNNALDIAVLGNIGLKKHLKKVGLNERKNFYINESVSLLHEGVNRAHQVVKNLLTFSKKNSEGFHYQNIQEGIESSLQILDNELKKRITVHKDFCEIHQKIYCDLNQLNQLFLNLLKNASDAIENKGNIWIKTSKENGRFIISIKDDGSGIAETDRIFDPFFTTKPVGSGTGLGLSISYNIVRDHCGKIECKSQIGIGSEFIITLPVDCSKEKMSNG